MKKQPDAQTSIIFRSMSKYDRIALDKIKARCSIKTDSAGAAYALQRYAVNMEHIDRLQIERDRLRLTLADVHNAFLQSEAAVAQVNTALGDTRMTLEEIK